MTDEEIIALTYLPDKLSCAIWHYASMNVGKPINEIRLRAGGSFSLVSAKVNIPMNNIAVTREDLAHTINKLCRGSLYTYAEDIKNGVICADSGIRAGVCGSGVVSNGKLERVREITSISLRIPHRAKGCADFLLPIIHNFGGALIYSPPAGGKTTMLRELIPLLSKNNRVSVIDTRYELSTCFGKDERGMTDMFLGYPRYDGIMSAGRTMSPEYIICDEISTDDDARAVIYAKSAGIRVIASAHAGNTAQLYKNKAASIAIESGAFGCLCGLNTIGSGEATVTIPDSAKDCGNENKTVHTSIQMREVELL